MFAPLRVLKKIPASWSEVFLVTKKEDRYTQAVWAVASESLHSQNPFFYNIVN